MANGPKITLRDLPLPVRQGNAPARGSRGLPAPRYALTRGEHFNLHATEERLILQALEESKGNVTVAARNLGISRRTLHRKLKEFRKETPPTPSDTSTSQNGDRDQDPVTRP
jgi:transcriptional regulator of acetoin/glycerol metabolism